MIVCREGGVMIVVITTERGGGGHLPTPWRCVCWSIRSWLQSPTTVERPWLLAGRCPGRRGT